MDAFSKVCFVLPSAVYRKQGRWRCKDKWLSQTGPMSAYGREASMGTTPPLALYKLSVIWLLWSQITSVPLHFVCVCVMCVYRDAWPCQSDASGPHSYPLWPQAGRSSPHSLLSVFHCHPHLHNLRLHDWGTSGSWNWYPRAGLFQLIYSLWQLGISALHMPALVKSLFIEVAYTKTPTSYLTSEERV